MTPVETLRHILKTNKHIGYVSLVVIDVGTKDFEQAMEEYAKQEAIGLMNFLYGNSRLMDDGVEPEKAYELYLKSKDGT